MVAPLFYARGKKAGLLVRLVRWWMLDEPAIREREAHTGQRTVKKGGQNGPPRSTRPPPPKP
jgi:hypothetical protein